MNEKDYYTDLISRLQALKVQVPDCLNVTEREQVLDRIEETQWSARQLLACMKPDEDRH